MPVKFWPTIVRFWFFLSYLITTVPKRIKMFLLTYSFVPIDYICKHSHDSKSWASCYSSFEVQYIVFFSHSHWEKRPFSCKELQNPSWSSNTCQRPVSVSQVVRSPGSVALTAHAYKLATWWLFALSGKTDLGVVACMIKVMFVWHQSGRKCGVGSQRTCSDFFPLLARILTIDKKYRILTCRDKRESHLIVL